MDAAASERPVRVHVFELAPREQLLEQIVDLIVSGDIKDRESEASIAGMLAGTPSRTPVREAIALLVRDGMFDQIPKSGLRLRHVTSEELEEIYALRGRLEQLAVFRLAARPLDLPDELIAAQESVASGSDDPVAVVARDSAFHQAIAQAAGYRLAAGSLRSWGNRIRVFRATHPLQEGDIEALIEHHAVLMGALQEHDPQTAAQVIADHLADDLARTKSELGQDGLSPQAEARGVPLSKAERTSLGVASSRQIGIRTRLTAAGSSSPHSAPLAHELQEQ
jgi:DNA-binding GntR family transcriptional regulator